MQKTTRNVYRIHQASADSKLLLTQNNFDRKTETALTLFYKGSFSSGEKKRKNKVGRGWVGDGDGERDELKNKRK